MAENITAATQPASSEPRFGVQRIYIKDLSFESPDSPESFRRPYTPSVNFNLNTRSRQLEAEVFEVVLRLTAEVKQDEKTVFLVEVQQAGIFEVAGIEGDQLEQVLATTCPGILFPYGREAVDSLVIKASFPALMLAPINFEAIYQQAKQQQAAQQQVPAS